MKLIDIARVIRTKNSGPFIITIDIIFKDEQMYYKLKKRNYFSSDWWASLYNIPPEDVLSVFYFDPAFAVKANIKRYISSGDFGDSDVYGAQQHAPLLEVEIEDENG
ncbi:MAG: acyl-CoA synthetase [Dictyoglomus sp. NZ13-RE01]|nr:MAG: acyl-CoA synthetase [Dictyoglomus sp. NZ13-RE01]